MDQTLLFGAKNVDGNENFRKHVDADSEYVDGLERGAKDKLL
jgi:hypothetical protein